MNDCSDVLGSSIQSFIKLVENMLCKRPLQPCYRRMEVNASLNICIDKGFSKRVATIEKKMNSWILGCQGEVSWRKFYQSL